MSKILIVDDSNPARMSMKFSLSQQGFEVLTAENGVEGLDQAKKNGDLSVIITDINMPRMDGFEMVEKIRKLPEHRTTPIVALSVDEQKGNEALAKGASAFVIKSSKSSEEVKRFINLYVVRE